MKKYFVFLLSIAFIIISAIIVFGHGSQSEHDRDLKCVLYGRTDIKLKNEDTKKCFQFIADAAAICIDQFSSNDEEQKKIKVYEELKAGVGLPYSFDSINLNKDNVGNPVNITADTHRAFTHRGWYFSYPTKQERDFWSLRQKVLIVTVNKLLFCKPNIINDLFANYEKPDNKKCEAFCCLIYCVHILGDHVAGDTPKKISPLVLEPIARYSDQYGIIYDLKEALKTLITDHNNSYNGLITELDIIGEKANSIIRQDGGQITSDENAKINMQLAQDVLDVLADKLPGLLNIEEFFKNSPLKIE